MRRLCVPKIVMVLFLLGTVLSCKTVPPPPDNFSVQFPDGSQAGYQLKISNPTNGKPVGFFSSLFTGDKSFIDAGTGTAEGPGGLIVVRWKVRTTVTPETSHRSLRVDFDEVELFPSESILSPRKMELTGNEALPFVLSRFQGATGTILVEVTGFEGYSVEDQDKYSREGVFREATTQYRFLRKEDQSVLGRFADNTLFITEDGQVVRDEILEYTVFLTTLRLWLPAVVQYYSEG